MQTAQKNSNHSEPSQVNMRLPVPEHALLVKLSYFNHPQFHVHFEPYRSYVKLLSLEALKGVIKGILLLVSSLVSIPSLVQLRLLDPDTDGSL
ncbi:hypothetical protein TNCV_2067071 [Trichonephila clavipes]|uniref:Uncharacterized protein n=1 Tax=Trichonephila clavipes TaxID=2585209 RepID=A0A8X6W3G7_TRICX|nr:hypothetical protein TNCV_2067071 [Trichonephila clavipes]